MIRQTSILAYREIKKDGVVDTDKQIYMEILRAMGCPSTDREVAAFGKISDMMRMERRRNDLVHEGLIQDAGIRKCSISKRLCHTWWFTC